jgi:serine/threonine protein phosphatase PrpC
MLRFGYAGRSHQGLVRDNNEDSGFAGPYLQLVADGVGGAASGEVASATAAYVTSATTMGSSDRDLREVLARAVSRVHEQLRAGVAAEPAHEGMSTTLTAVLTDGSQVALAHLGDSRAYLLRDGQLSQLTHDQTFVQMLVDEGQISAEQARHHPQRNVVLQALDGDAAPVPDLELLDLRPGDRLLVCSDGLSDMVDDGRVAQCLAEPDRDAAVDTLVEAALAAGGRDNVTALVADVEDGPLISRDGALLGALRNPCIVVDPAAVRSGRAEHETALD